MAAPTIAGQQPHDPVRRHSLRVLPRQAGRAGCRRRRRRSATRRRRGSAPHHLVQQRAPRRGGPRPRCPARARPAGGPRSMACRTPATSAPSMPEACARSHAHAAPDAGPIPRPAPQRRAGRARTAFGFHGSTVPGSAHDEPGAERVRAAHDRAEVARVLHRVQHHDQSRARRHHSVQVCRGSSATTTTPCGVSVPTAASSPLVIGQRRHAVAQRRARRRRGGVLQRGRHQASREDDRGVEQVLHEAYALDQETGRFPPWPPPRKCAQALDFERLSMARWNGACTPRHA
jgi:hypothetical protein